MGFLDMFKFGKDKGEKVFENDAEAAARITSQIEGVLAGIKDLDVKYDDGTVTLCGECESQAVREQAVLLAGNVQGVSGVLASGLTVAETTEPEEKVEFYEIKSGDSLSKIAKHYYGDPMAYKRIFEANRGVLGDNPDKIYPGQQIRIPLD